MKITKLTLYIFLYSVLDFLVLIFCIYFSFILSIILPNFYLALLVPLLMFIICFEVVYRVLFQKYLDISLNWKIFIKKHFFILALFIVESFLVLKDYIAFHGRDPEARSYFNTIFDSSKTLTIIALFSLIGVFYLALQILMDYIRYKQQQERRIIALKFPS